MHCNFGNVTLTEINSAQKKNKTDVADLFDGAPFKSWPRIQKKRRIVYQRIM